MLRNVLKSKLHRATVTDANVHYEGSITIPTDLMEEADLWEGERVLVTSITNGQRLETYVITAPAGSGQIVINGAAAHRIHAESIVGEVFPSVAIRIGVIVSETCRDLLRGEVLRAPVAHGLALNEKRAGSRAVVVGVIDDRLDRVAAMARGCARGTVVGHVHHQT